ncbi:putative reverse transcriptase domain-containing protein [Tanacetum coccineum]|uniref:Reverse transcriptase domain-containing protein n=1 Tax=Tanacetum coccineum TaxID=301880 RepID=A0ABQ5EJI9_9ASTR
MIGHYVAFSSFRLCRSVTATNLEGCSENSFEPYVPREARLGVDVEDESSKPSRYRGTDLEMDDDVVRSDGIDIDLEIQVEINECIAYADALRDRGINARVVVEAIDQEEIKTGARSLVEVRVDRVTHPVIADDIPEPTQEKRAVEVTYKTLGDLVQRFHDHTEEIPLERDNMRLKDMMDVVSQRVTQSQRREWRVQREKRPIQRFRFYDHMRIARLVPGGIWATVLRLFLEYPKVDPMVPNEEDKVERFVGGSPDNIQGNVIAAEPTKLQDEICIANNLMDQKLKGYARSAENKRRLENNPRDRGMVPNEEDKVERLVGGLPENIQGNGYARSAENKRRLENNPRDNRGQQLVFKWQNVKGQNVPRAYTARNNEKKGPGHFRKDYPKLRNQNHGNQTRNKNGNKTRNQTGGNEVIARAYVIGGGGKNPDSNVVTGTFLLNNCYASMLFDSGADRSFVSSTISTLLDVVPSTLDTSYAVELADGRISETNVVDKGCT